MVEDSDTATQPLYDYDFARSASRGNIARAQIDGVTCRLIRANNEFTKPGSDENAAGHTISEGFVIKDRPCCSFFFDEPLELCLTALKCSAARAPAAQKVRSLRERLDTLWSYANNLPSGAAEHVAVSKGSSPSSRTNLDCWVKSTKGLRRSIRQLSVEPCGLPFAAPRRNPGGRSDKQKNHDDQRKDFARRR